MESWTICAPNCQAGIPSTVFEGISDGGHRGSPPFQPDRLFWSRNSIPYQLFWNPKTDFETGSSIDGEQLRRWQQLPLVVFWMATNLSDPTSAAVPEKLGWTKRSAVL